MANTHAHLELLRSDIAFLREQLAQVSTQADGDGDRAFLFRELAYSLVTYKALLRKQRKLHPSSYEGVANALPPILSTLHLN